MNAPAFTPGPWRAVPTTAPGHHPDTLRQDVVSDGTEFAPSFVAGDMKPEDAAAVAVLPELYEALAMLVRESVHPYDGGEYEDGEWAALDAARAALAKATRS